MIILQSFIFVSWLLTPVTAETQTANEIEQLIGDQRNNTAALSRIQAASWVNSPTVRGSIEILWTCIITLLACVWSVLHLNIPEKKGKYSGFFDKLRWAVIAIISPEGVLSMAINQLIAARNLRKELLSQGSADKDTITLEFCFFVIMGGFQFSLEDEGIKPGPNFRRFANEKDQAVLQISPAGFLKMTELGILDLESTIKTANVAEKSKANVFQKILVATQVFWMALQCLVRKIQALPITLLEIHTMVHVVCAMFVLSTWFSKPFDINSPEFIDTRSEDMKGFLSLAVQSQLCKNYGERFEFVSQQTNHQHDQGLQIDNGSATSHLRETHRATSFNSPMMDNEPQRTNHALEMGVIKHNYSDLLACGIKVVAGPPEIEVSLEPADLLRIQRAAAFCRTFLAERDFPGDIAFPRPGFAGCFSGKGNLPSGFDRRMKGLTFGNWIEPFVDMSETAGRARSNFADLLSISLPLIYSGIHLSAWNAEFPTLREGILWKVASIASSGGAIGFCFVLLEEYIVVDPSPQRLISRKLSCLYFIVAALAMAMTLLGTLGSILARLFLTAESFASIRALPIGAYSMPVWLQMMPHL